MGNLFILFVVFVFLLLIMYFTGGWEMIIFILEKSKAFFGWS